MPLNMCCSIIKGDYLTRKDARAGSIPVILGGQQPAYYIDKANHTGEAIVVSRSGASAGFVSWWQEPIFVTDGFMIEPTDVLRNRFLYHYLKDQQEHINHNKRGSGVPHITSQMLSSIRLPIIPLHIQDNIIMLLDSLFFFTTELSKELADEINARKQQFEYYRSILLSFSKKQVA